MHTEIWLKDESGLFTVLAGVQIHIHIKRVYFFNGIICLFFIVRKTIFCSRIRQQLVISFKIIKCPHMENSKISQVGFVLFYNPAFSGTALAAEYKHPLPVRQFFKKRFLCKPPAILILYSSIIGKLSAFCFCAARSSLLA